MRVFIAAFYLKVIDLPNELLYLLCMNAQKKNVILTGTTGILGSYVLLELLRNHPEIKIHYLVRAGSREEGKDRVRKILRFYSQDSEVFKRFEEANILLGDMVQTHLGLSQEDLSSITSEAGTIIHCAASTNLFLPYEKMKEVNLTGAKNVVAVANAGRHNVINISSYSVFAENLFKENAKLDEFTQIDPNQKYPLFSGYAKSKIDVEFLFRDSKDLNFEWCNVRAGNIFGESETGLYPFSMASVNNFFYEIMSLIPTLGSTTKTSNFFDVAPVDYVAKGIICILKNGFHPCQNYHLLNPFTPTIHDQYLAFRELGYDIHNEPDWDRYMEKYKAMMKNPDVKESIRNKLSLLMVGKDVFKIQNTCVDSSWTYKFLKGHGIECPKVDGSLIQKLYHHYQLAFGDK